MKNAIPYVTALALVLTHVLADDSFPSGVRYHACKWAYYKADGNLLGGGTGAGLLGVRRRGNSNEIRIDWIEYTIDHTTNTSIPESKIIYEGSIPENSLVFVRPFDRKDGTKLMHVTAFEVSNLK